MKINTMVFSGSVLFTNRNKDQKNRFTHVCIHACMNVCMCAYVFSPNII